MNLLSSLRSRIFLTTALLAVLSIGVSIYIVSVRVERQAEQALQAEIGRTGDLVQQLRTTRTDTYTVLAKLVADAPKVKAALSTNDGATVQGVLNEYPDQLKSNLLLITNRAGSVLAIVGTSPRMASVVANQPSLRRALAGRESFALLPQPEGMLQLVTVPIAIGPEVAGTLSVGFLLDDALAAQLKQVTGSDIVFGMDGQVLATTMPHEDLPALSELVRRAERIPSVTLGSEEFSALPLSLAPPGEQGPPGAGPVALILRSRTESRRFLGLIHTQLAAILIVAVLLATLLSFAVARTITQPLAAITRVMREVAATGDLTRKIVLRGSARWNDEDARLLAATFNTLTDSIARFQREVSQKERLSSLGRLSTVIAHEVRNPLMIIKAALHTLGQPHVPRQQLEEAVRDIDGEIARLNRLVNEVLDFARPIQFELAPADLNKVCKESAAAAEAVPGVSVALNLDPSLPIVTTDAERLRVALVNLISNARPAVEASDGQAAAPVSVSTASSDGHASIVVADAGAGIDSTDLARVFDPYFTTKRGGTGLGLPIARNIIEGLGGPITVASTKGRGTQMRVDLPLDVAVPPAVSQLQ